MSPPYSHLPRNLSLAVLQLHGPCLPPLAEPEASSQLTLGEGEEPEGLGHLTKQALPPPWCHDVTAPGNVRSKPS